MATLLKIENLPISKIRTDGGTQSRKTVNEAAIRDYAEARKAGAAFPPPVVYFDGTDHWLSEGFHRVASAKLAGLKVLDCEVRRGGRFEALVNSLGSNTAHGVRRTNEDKRYAVEVCLRHPELAKWSDRKIAETCAVSNRFVGSVREGLSVNGTQIGASRLFERSGKTYSMKVDKAVAKLGAEGESPPESAAAGAPEESESEPEEEPAPGRDALGIPLPDGMAAVFAARDKFREAVGLVRRLNELLDAISKAPGGEHLARFEMKYTETRKDGKERPRYRNERLDALAFALKRQQPHASVCPHCFGKHGRRRVDPDCGCCLGLGWVSLWAFDRCDDRLCRAVEALAAEGEGGAA